MTRRGGRQRAIARVTGRDEAAVLAGLFAFFAFVLSGASARAQVTPPADGASATAATPAPPPLDIPYVQFGVAFTTEFVADTASFCRAVSPTAPCILGSGGGVVARLGRRSAGPWYFGAAYELSKQDPSNLYRFATLQQLRAEARWYLDTGRDVYPYLAAGSGAVGYGDEWGVDTYGPIESLGIGVEAQLSRRTVVGLAVSYRFLLLNDYFEAGTYERGASFVQVLGFDLFLEERSPIVRGPTPL